MTIFQVRDNEIHELDGTTFEALGLRERYDLQRLLRTQIRIVAADTLVLTEEFSDWDDSRRRIDLLGLDKNANLVVFELKRSDDGGHMELQALRYAAMVASMTFEKAVEVYSDFLARTNQSVDAQSSILEFLAWDGPDEERFAQDVRIVLVAADFGKELTTSVLWLNEYGLDIRCVRMKPYADDCRIFLDVQQVLPLPEAEDYTVRFRQKAGRERDSRREQTDSQQFMSRFWTELLAKAKARTEIHADVTTSKATWVGVSAGRPGLSINYAFSRSTPRVDLYFNSNRETNKRYFDQLHAAREEIETRFGAPLFWERLDEKQGCRIRFELPPGTARDESKWPELQDQMIDAMIRFEAALRPAIDRLPR